jgi:hypothetical protein
MICFDSIAVMISVFSYSILSFFINPLGYLL